MRVDNMFFTQEELETMAFKRLGQNVKIDRLTPIYHPEKISIGNNVRIGSFCILSGDITIGDFVHIASYCFLNAGNDGIEIGDFVNIGSYSRLLCSSDDYSGKSMVSECVPENFKNTQCGKIVLKKHCLLGSGVLVLPNVVLEIGTSVAAMSMVKQNTQAFGIYAGIPARRLKDRSQNLLKLEKVFLKSPMNKPSIAGGGGNLNIILTHPFTREDVLCA